MGVFDEKYNEVNSFFSDWIKVNDNKSKWTIESLTVAGYNEELIKPHCLDCIIVNNCWFVNEEGKRPNGFDYSKYTLVDIPYNKRGLFHPNCHCKKVSINIPKIEDIQIFDLERRIDYLFDKKKGWLAAWGYDETDKKEICSLLENLCKKSYCEGLYKNNPPKEESKKKYGFRIRIFIDLPGKREKAGRVYRIHSSYIVYPNGKLKNNTPIGGRLK